jgi:phosphocarrier protein
MMLAAGRGAALTVEAEGEDAEAALTAIRELVAGKFGEGE